MLPGCAGPVGGRVSRVGSGFQRRSICCQQTISAKRFLRAQQGREAVEQRLQRRGQQLLSLLDKRRGRGCFFAVLEPSDEHLPNAVFAHGQQQGYDRFKGQRPGPGEVPAWASDIVFGVFPHFPDQRMQHMNHAMYAEIFPYIFRRQVWLGHNSGHFWFRVPDYYEAKGTDFKEDDEGQKWRRMGNICWFTNMDIEKRHQSLVETLYKKYTVEEYPQYDNFEAIHVKKVQDIPVDYDGIISVPITFLDKHNPDEFEIVGELNHGCDSEFDLAKPILNGVAQYKRIAIRRKTAQEAGED
mgnify:CR=1 FL=1